MRNLAKDDLAEDLWMLLAFGLGGVLVSCMIVLAVSFVFTVFGWI